VKYLIIISAVALSLSVAAQKQNNANSYSARMIMSTHSKLNHLKERSENGIILDYHFAALEL
jgi:hypothetical protein